MAGFLEERRRRMVALKGLRTGARSGGDSAGSTRGVGASSSTSCPSCSRDVAAADLEQNRRVCPYCGHHFALGARERIALVVDRGSFKEMDRALVTADPLGFPGYADKVRALSRETHVPEALVGGTARIGGCKVAVAAMDTRFMMASMGAVVGEKLARLVERASKGRLPLVVFCASGGARMQEGAISLMQMAKTAMVLRDFSQRGGLFISIMTNPTTGGVTASFASLGDVMLAEPGALIGFAGPRVIEQTIGEKLPQGFQTAEYLLEHGFIDQVVPRARIRATLARLLALYGREVERVG